MTSLRSQLQEKVGSTHLIRVTTATRITAERGYGLTGEQADNQTGDVGGTTKRLRSECAYFIFLFHNCLLG